MKCEEIRKTVYLFLDGEMPVSDSKEFADHLAACDCCSRLVEMERAVIKTIKVRSPRYHAPASLRALVAEAGEASSPANIAMGWFTRRRFAVLAAASAMALVVLAVYFGFEDSRAPGDPSGSGMTLKPAAARQGAGLPSVTASVGGTEFPMAGFGVFGRIRPGGAASKAWTGMAGREAEQLKLKSLRQRAEQMRLRKTYLVHGEHRIMIRPEFVTAEADENGDDVAPLPIQAQYGYFIHDR